MAQSKWQKLFSKGFKGTNNGTEELSEKEKRDARRKKRIEGLSPEERENRKRKIKDQGGYKDGGVVDSPCGFDKIKKLVKKKK